MGEAMSHIANPYIKKQSNAGCWTGKPLRRASETGMQTKSRAPGTGSFLLSPLSPVLCLYAENLQYYIQAVYPHRRCIEHKAHCQGVSFPFLRLTLCVKGLLPLGNSPFVIILWSPEGAFVYVHSNETRFVKECFCKAVCNL